MVNLCAQEGAAVEQHMATVSSLQAIRAQATGGAPAKAGQQNVVIQLEVTLNPKTLNPEKTQILKPGLLAEHNPAS